MKATEIADLKTHYQQYPEPLHIDNLIRLFTDKINKFITPYMERGPDCKVNEIIVPKWPNTSIYPYADRKDTLTIFVTLDIRDNIQPRLAVITAKYYRPGRTDKQILTDLGFEYASVIPLTLSDSDIAQELTKLHVPIATTDLMH